MTDQMRGQKNWPAGRQMILILSLACGLLTGLTAWLYWRSPTGLTLAACLLSGALCLVDGAWVWRFPDLRGLARFQAVLAWLIYHTAFFPLTILAGRFTGPGQLAFALGQAALLVMGALPLAVIVWLEKRLHPSD